MNSEDICLNSLLQPQCRKQASGIFELKWITSTDCNILCSASSDGKLSVFKVAESTLETGENSHQADEVCSAKVTDKFCLSLDESLGINQVRHLGCFI